ncbi:MAG: acetate/propionate family kinase [Pirellulales bacterium]|nr:acetate/propionate family kinase [Pirellulales bacterium]
MSDGNLRRILTINSGSSSIKCSLYEMGEAEDRVLSGTVERIGLHGGHLRFLDAAGRELVDSLHDLPDHDAALKTLFEWLKTRFSDRFLDAVGHRVVHGGTKYCQPSVITEELTETLEEIIRLAPEHLPHELKAIRAVEHHYPQLTQVACFDTAFHRRMPEIAQRIPLPRSLWHEGVLRYGFHGLSYEYILMKLREIAPAEAEGRVIIAHLGNGCSMAAVQSGVGVETTMGLTPAGGMMMGTRSGDLDPGILLYLLQEKDRSPSTLDYLINQRSGLIGVSGCSSDLRDLLRLELSEPNAAQAVEMFCYQARKFVGALAAVLGGLDALVFTAGIGTNSPEIRRRICHGLEFLGVHLDPARNESNASVISREEGPVTVRVMKTDEELMIARHTCKLLGDL